MRHPGQMLIASVLLLQALAVSLGVILFVPAAPALAEVSWPTPLYDPAGATDAEQAADLVLPMPCGGAMAFQKVNVPVEPGNPIDDRAIRLGQSQAETAYSDYLRPEFLRGAFGNWAEGQSHYFIARYELTTGQFRALDGDCDPGGPGDRVAKGDLSWFDAIDLGRRYTEWLLSDAPDALPANGDVRGFIRLPTEVEWEYATRGGSRIDASAFRARRFLDGDIGAYAMFQGTARGLMAPVGSRLGNPLGLFDVYGNAEELMLEPFRLNAVGRSHGQVGGLVTRGGSFRSLPEQLSSASRVEYPPFRFDGTALAGDTFGVRFVISAAVTSNDAYLGEIQTAWGNAAAGSDADDGDAPDKLTAKIADEPDPERAAALEAEADDGERRVEPASRIWLNAPSGPEGEAQLDSDQRRLVQEALNMAGFDTGGIDGQFGSRTLSAISQARRSFGLPVHELVDDQLIAALPDAVAMQLLQAGKARRISVDELPPGSDARLVKALEPLRYTEIRFGYFRGHLYIAAFGSVNFAAAKAMAERAGGHLVTISDRSENQFVYDLFSFDERFRVRFANGYIAGPFIGLSQSQNAKEPAGGWRWVNGEPVTYTRWARGYPNNLNGGQDFAAYARPAESRNEANGPFLWVDVIGFAHPGYIIEIE